MKILEPKAKIGDVVVLKVPKNKQQQDGPDTIQAVVKGAVCKNGIWFYIFEGSDLSEDSLYQEKYIIGVFSSYRQYFQESNA